jgi:hypothetical protein
VTEWRYLRCGSVVHALSLLTTTNNLAHVALCGVAPTWLDDWYGTGSQAEYERAATLRRCKRCLTAMGPVRAAREERP